MLLLRVGERLVIGDSSGGRVARRRGHSRTSSEAVAGKLETAGHGVLSPVKTTDHPAAENRTLWFETECSAARRSAQHGAPEAHPADPQSLHVASSRSLRTYRRGVRCRAAMSAMVSRMASGPTTTSGSGVVRASNTDCTPRVCSQCACVRQTIARSSDATPALQLVRGPIAAVDEHGDASGDQHRPGDVRNLSGDGAAGSDEDAVRGRGGRPKRRGIDGGEGDRLGGERRDTELREDADPVERREEVVGSGGCVEVC